ncbi:MAG: hypothetical protein ACI4HM_05955, partial [Ruminococcus sp.]
LHWLNIRENIPKHMTVMLTDIEKQNQDMMRLNSRRKAIGRFIYDLSKRDELLTEFDNCLWLTVVDTVTVQSDGTLIFKFNDGTAIEG